MTRVIPVLTALFVCTSPKLLFAEIRYVRAGDDLQAALNAARSGDELRLAPNATFSGNFVLPAVSGSSGITVRTDLPDESLPGARQRVTPQTSSGFARIVSPNNAPALATAPGAHDWRLAYLEFGPTRDGYGDILQIGDGSPDQNQMEQVPSALMLDHLYIHGDPVTGQKRGIALNGRAITIRNCYISDIKAVGADSQAIGGWNGPGPYTIENNYLEATGEVVLLGGADPSIPNLVAEDVAVRYNHMTRPMAWRGAIVPTPSSVTALGTSGGTLAAGVYGYRIVAQVPAGQGNVASSMPSAEVTAVASSGAVRVSWAAVANASNYRVYMRTPSGVTSYFTVRGTTFLNTTTAGGTRGAVPTTATEWQVKNLFELKNARRVKVEYNLFENNWAAAQAGYSILITPRNQDGGCPWCQVEQVEIAHNVVRHVTGGFNISGYDDNNPSLQTNAVNIHDNLLYDITTTLGGSGWPVLLGEAPGDITFDRNTMDFDGTTLLYAYGRANGQSPVIAGFKFTNNSARHGQYGINGADASTGTLTLQMYFPGAVFTGNWLSGGSASRYPPGNRFEEPFDAKLNTLTAAVTQDGPGADVAKLMPLATTVTQGVLPIGAVTGGTAPRAPGGLRVTSPGR